METERILNIGFYIPAEVPYISDEDKLNIFLNTENGWMRLLLLILEYLIDHKRTFDEADLIFTSEENVLYLNGSATGLFGKLYQNKIDIIMPPFALDIFLRIGWTIVTHLEKIPSYCFI